MSMDAGCNSTPEASILCCSNEAFFKCVFSKGVCLSGKKYEMIFEYSPDMIGTHESYWSFEIPEMNIVKYFLVVG